MLHLVGRIGRVRRAHDRACLQNRVEGDHELRAVGHDDGNPITLLDAHLAKRDGKSIAQVVLRWLIQREVVVIPKSIRPDRMAENFDVFGFELDEQDMQNIAALDTGESLFFDHRTPESAQWLGSHRIEH